jgi:PTS system mannitol-specific IIC component
MVILKRTATGEEDLDKATAKMKELKNKKEDTTVTGNVSKIVVACDAGMGSSAMGASLLRKKVKAAGLNIEVENRAINNLTEDIDIVITHSDLTSRAKSVVKNPTHLSISNFMEAGFYDDLVEQLKKKR